MLDTGLMTTDAEAAALLVAPEPADMSNACMDHIEEHPHWLAISRLPVVLTSRIPLGGFKVHDLLQLEQGQLIRSNWSTSEDIPVKIGRLHLAWSEFEVVEESMALRLTRLA